MHCPMCGYEFREGYFCPKCGYILSQSAAQSNHEQNTQQAPQYPVHYPHSKWVQPGHARNWAIASLMLGIASWFVLPIIFTPLGVILGAISLRKESNKLAMVGITVSILGLIAGILAGALLQ